MPLGGMHTLLPLLLLLPDWRHGLQAAGTRRLPSLFLPLSLSHAVFPTYVNMAGGCSSESAVKHVLICVSLAVAISLHIHPCGCSNQPAVHIYRVAVAMV